MTTRKILHLDLDAFFCAVEELSRPELSGQPFAVGGRPEQRGVISSCSYAARQYGIHSAMPTAHALRLYPQLVILPSNFRAYHQASEQVMEIICDLTPLVEQISIDEAFLDVSDLPQPAGEIAGQLQAAIRSKLSLPCSLGVASNKLIAKIANNIGKASRRGPWPPNSIMVVPPGEEAAFLSPLPVKELWGVGPKTAERLTATGIKTIGQLAQAPQKYLVEKFGKLGYDLARHAAGIDERPVEGGHTVKSISQEITFERDVAEAGVLRRQLSEMAAQVGYRLRRQGFFAGTVRLKIRWPDFTTLTRQKSLQQPTDQDGVITSQALHLFEELWHTPRPVRLIGVGVSNLSRPARQLGLWDAANDKERRLLQAMDDLRLKYGKMVVRRGRVKQSRDES